MDWADSPPADPRMLLLASFVSTRDFGVGAARWSEDGWRGANTLAAVLLLRAVLRAQPGQRIAAIAPSNAFALSYDAPRRRLLAAANVHLVAESDGAWAEELGMHSAFRLSLFCFERRADSDQPEPSRFLTVPRHSEPGALAQELKALLRQGGGRTDHGYVERDPLDAARPLQYAAFDPVRDWQRIELTADVNPDILGGIVLRVGNSILDASIRNRLDNLNKHVARGA